MLFKKNKRNLPSEAEVDAIEQRIRAARDSITARRPASSSATSPSSTPESRAHFQGPPRPAQPPGPVMPSQVPDFLSISSPDGLQPSQATTLGGTRRVLPGDIPAFLQNPDAHAAPAPDHAQPERVLPSDIPSEEASKAPGQAPFTFPAPIANWKRL